MFVKLRAIGMTRAIFFSLLGLVQNLNFLRNKIHQIKMKKGFLSCLFTNTNNSDNEKELGLFILGKNI